MTVAEVLAVGMQSEAPSSIRDSCHGTPHIARRIRVTGRTGGGVTRTADNGALQQIEDGVSGLFVPHQDPAACAAAILRLVRSPALRARLGAALRGKVAATYAVEAVVPQWRAIFEAVLSEVAPAPPPRLFRSFLQGGWECSTHRLPGGRRLDVVAGNGHDANARSDYSQLGSLGIATLRDGLRWHRIDRRRGWYDFSSWTPMLRAAEAEGAEVIWDLLHYGWPDDLDIWTPGFVDRFAAFARAVARHSARRRTRCRSGARSTRSRSWRGRAETPPISTPSRGAAASSSRSSWRVPRLLRCTNCSRPIRARVSFTANH